MPSEDVVDPGCDSHWALVVGTGEPIVVRVDAVDPKLLKPALPFDELFPEGEDDLSISFLSASRLLPGSEFIGRDMPGSCIREALSGASAMSLSSTCVFRYAAEPWPRSAVCRNHVGSFDASDCAIASLAIGAVSSACDDGSGVALGERAAFSVAITDSGRVFGRSEA